MDLNAILPLLLTSNGASAGDIIRTVMGGSNPQMGALLDLMSPSKPSAVGFSPVMGFISDDILGVMMKYLAG